jgi:hypothetical protein
MRLDLKQVGPLLKRGLPIAAFFVSPATLFAQSCAMCYQSAAASGPRSIRALKHGILVLMIPPVLITAGFAWMTFSKRDQSSEDE